MIPRESPFRCTALSRYFMRLHLTWRRPLKTYWKPPRKFLPAELRRKAARLTAVAFRESDERCPTLERAYTPYTILHDFDLAKAEGYQQQYGDLYFLRLAKLKPAVEQVAQEAWSGYQVISTS